ncbi:MAG: ATP-dependent Clp protease proteolytic subunit [Aestuariivirgaceae bacterium]
MAVKLNRIALVVMIGIAGYLAWQHQQQLFEDKGRLVAARDPAASDTVVLSWRSEIDVPMRRRVLEAYDEWKGKVRRIVIDLHSPGGSLMEGRRVIELINTMKRTHRVDTRVGTNHSCLSMCVPIYLQGQTRFAAASSQWMFHEPRVFDYFTGEEVKTPKSEREGLARRFFGRYFTNSEMDPAWRRQLEQQWRGKDVWRTGRQLVDEGSNIIHELF